MLSVMLWHHWNENEGIYPKLDYALWELQMASVATSEDRKLLCCPKEVLRDPPPLCAASLEDWNQLGQFFCPY
jgi:hypothetical protein